MRRASQENLPKLLPPDPGRPDTVAYRLDTDTLRSLLITQNQANAKLSTLILIHRDGTYADMVDILDEIDYLERGWNAGLAERLDKKVSELTKEDGKFSYRYAIGDWQDRDDRIMSYAIQAAQASGELQIIGTE
jgi:hypothetical protein